KDKADSPPGRPIYFCSNTKTFRSATKILSGRYSLRITRTPGQIQNEVLPGAISAGDLDFRLSHTFLPTSIGKRDCSRSLFSNVSTKGKSGAFWHKISEFFFMLVFLWV